MLAQTLSARPTNRNFPQSLEESDNFHPARYQSITYACERRNLYDKTQNFINGKSYEPQLTGDYAQWDDQFNNWSLENL